MARISRIKVQKMLLVLLGLYLLVTVLLGLFQRSLLYRPWPDRSPPPAGFSEIDLDTPEGKIQAWYRPAAAGQTTVIFFDGNAGNLPGAVRITHGLSDSGRGLLLVSYPGYDGNPGSPTEQSLYQAGRSALAWLDGQNIRQRVILGYSLGTGVAVQMALEHPVQALILMAPYASMTRAAAVHLPLLPTSLLLLDRYDSESKIGRIHAPLLIIHGDADRTVPITEGWRLFGVANQPKQFVTIQHTGHLLTVAPALDEIETFLVKAQ